MRIRVLTVIAVLGAGIWVSPAAEAKPVPPAVTFNTGSLTDINVSMTAVDEETCREGFPVRCERTTTWSATGVFEVTDSMGERGEVYAGPVEVAWEAVSSSRATPDCREFTSVGVVDGCSYYYAGWRTLWDSDPSQREKLTLRGESDGDVVEVVCNMSAERYLVAEGNPGAPVSVDDRGLAGIRTGECDTQINDLASSDSGAVRLVLAWEPANGRRNITGERDDLGRSRTERSVRTGMLASAPLPVPAEDGH